MMHNFCTDARLRLKNMRHKKADSANPPRSTSRCDAAMVAANHNEQAPADEREQWQKADPNRRAALCHRQVRGRQGGRHRRRWHRQGTQTGQARDVPSPRRASCQARRAARPRGLSRGSGERSDTVRGSGDLGRRLAHGLRAGARRRTGRRLLRGAIAARRRSGRWTGAWLGDASRSRRRDLRMARRPVRRHDHRRHDLALSAQRRRRHRGPPLLVASGRRPAGRGLGCAHQPLRGARAAVGQRGLDHHPADREASVSRQALRRIGLEERERVRGRLPPHHAVAQGAGSGLRDGDGSALHQGRDPYHLYQPRLSRRRHARLRSRVAALFRQACGAGEPRGGGNAGGSSESPHHLCTDQQPRPQPGPGLGHRRADAGTGLSQRRGGRGRPHEPGRSVAHRAAGSGRLFR